MGTYRTIYNSFWTDAKVVDDFTPEDRYFYLYVMTNPHTNLIGCYEISVRQMANEMGYSKETIELLLTRFDDIHGLLKYDSNTKELLIVNWSKYNWSESPKVKSAIEYGIDTVKSSIFKGFLRYALNSDTPSEFFDTLSEKNDTISKSDDILEQRTENSNSITYTLVEKSDEVDANTDCDSIVNEYNSVCVSLPKVTKLTPKRKKKIHARLKTYDQDTIRHVFVRAEQSDFLTGKKGGWRASFDWLMENDDNITKVLEGQYDNNKSSPRSPYEQAWMEVEGELNGVSVNQQRGTGG